MNKSPDINTLIKRLGAPVNSGYSIHLPSSIHIPAAPTLWKTLLWILIIIIVIVIVLTVIHFMITPIFKTKMGGPGFISMPITQDSQQYWLKESSTINTANTSIAGDKYSAYTISLDIMIEKIDKVSATYPIIFRRCDTSNNILPVPATIPNIASQIKPCNLVMYLDKNANDLLISSWDTGNNIKTIVIKNVPIRETFRITVVMEDKSIDVYYNSRLVGSTTFENNPSTNGLMLYGPDKDIPIKVRNLIIFSRSLMPAEVRDITPGLTQMEVEGTIADTTTCSVMTNTFTPIKEHVGDLTNLF